MGGVVFCLGFGLLCGYSFFDCRFSFRLAFY